MRLRTFTASDMPSAMKMVREAMGGNAIIVSSTPLNGSKTISVTAAVEQEDEWEDSAAARKTPSRQPSFGGKEGIQPATDHLRFELQNILRFHNVPELFSAKMMQRTSDKDLSSILGLHRIGGQRETPQMQRLVVEKLLSGYFRFEPLSVNDRRLMLVGPPGAGKTLTIAKLAARLCVDKKPLAVITTDNKRAGGVEQLKAFVDILGCEFHVASTRAELWKHLQHLPTRTHVLIDTAGCNAYSEAEMQEIAAYASLEDIEPVLTLPAGGDSLEAVDMAESFAELPIRRLLITRADTARRFGGVLATAAAHNFAFCNISHSSGIVDTLQSASAALLAQLLLHHQKKTG